MFSYGNSAAYDQAAKVSGDRDAEKRATANWSPAPVHPFALAGIALGLRDR